MSNNYLMDVNRWDSIIILWQIGGGGSRTFSVIPD